MSYFNHKKIPNITSRGDSAFVRYSKNADGTDFTEEWSSGQTYIGFATGQKAPIDKSEYTWFYVGNEIDLTLYVKNTDYATNTTAGTVKVSESHGVEMSEGGFLRVKKASPTDIDDKTDSCRPIVPSNLEYAVKSVTNNVYANTLKGTESGAVVAMDDVSPFTHKIGVKTSSKNLFDISKVELNNATKQGNAITITSKNCTIDIPLEKGTYTISWDYTGNAYIRDGKVDAGTIGTVKDGVGTCIYNAQKDGYLRVQIYDAIGVTISNVQIEHGTVATSYSPYASDNAVVTLKSLGKNVFDISQEDYFKHIDLTVDKNDKDIILTQSTGADYCAAYFKLPSNIAGKTVTISADVSTSGANKGVLRVHWANDKLGVGSEYLIGEAYTGQTPKKLTLTGVIPKQPDEDHKYLCLMLYNHTSGVLESGVTYTATYANVQVEFNPIATEYEPYTEHQTVTTTIAEGAALDSVTPNMTILSDTEGVTLECSYNKDTNKVIEKLTQAIISLGGNI